MTFVNSLMNDRILVHLIKSAAVANEMLNECLNGLTAYIINGLSLPEDVKNLLSLAVINSIEEYCSNDKYSVRVYIKTILDSCDAKVDSGEILKDSTLGNYIDQAVNLTNDKISSIVKVDDRLDALPLSLDVSSDLSYSINTFIEKDYAMGGITLSQSLDFNLRYLNDKRKLETTSLMNSEKMNLIN